MSHIPRINEFFVEGKNPKNSHVLLHITEPTTEKEKKRGYFFALCEIENGDLEMIEQAQKLIDDIESGYYETEEDVSGKNPFELTLEFINRRSSHLFTSKGSLHCIIGILRNTSISLSYHGTPNAYVFFLQKDKIQSIDILSGGGQEDSEHIFSSVIEGNINEKDRIFIGTPHITREISIERLKEVIMSRTVEQAVAHIDHVLKSARKDTSFGGIICDIVKNDLIADPAMSNSALSLQRLIDRERETTETLSPSLFGNKKRQNTNKIQKRNQKKHNSIETNHRHRRKGDEIIGGSFLNIILVAIGRILVSSSIGIWKIIRLIGTTLGRFVILLFILITNKNNGREHTLRAIIQNLKDIKNIISKMSFISKILLIGVLILSIVFSGSFMFLKIQKHDALEKIKYKNQIQAIEDKKNAAEARRIYNDDSSAFLLLKEAGEILDLLPQEDIAQKETYKKLKNMIDMSLLDLRDITVIDPTLIADINENTKDARATKLVRIDDKLIAFGHVDNRLYEIDKDTGSIFIQQYDSIVHIKEGNTPKENDTIVFIDQSNDLFIYTKKTKLLSKTTITYPTERTDIVAPFIYNLRLYMVDRANNQILRHSKTQSGYDKGIPWLDKEISVDLSDTVSMAIDGDILVLKENGKIIKFTGGEQMPFDITGLDPSLDKPTELYTYNDMDGIYIIEPTNRRVVVLNKQGTFRAQYTSDKWQNPTSMVIDETKKTIYVLDNNKIYSFNF